MPYIRKTRDEIEVQGNYGFGHGYECVCGAHDRREARALLRDYQANEPGVPFRIRTVRVKLESMV